MQTILYVHAGDDMYGADRILLQLIEGLDRGRFRPVVALPDDVGRGGPLSRALHERGVACRHMGLAVLRRRYFTPLGVLAYLWRLVASTILLARLIRHEGAAIVHSNTLAVIAGALAARLAGRPHVWHVHEIIVRPRFLWRLTAWLAPRLSRRVVAVSEATRAHLCAGDARNRAVAAVIHNGVDLARFAGAAGAGAALRRAWGVPDDAPLVGMIGRVSHWKGQDYFLEAIRLLRPRFPGARFAMVGSPFAGQEQLLAELRAAVAAAGLEGAVIVEAYRPDAPAVLDAYDVLVLPSTLPDPFPTVILEAMAMGRPVVANAHGGSRELVAHEETGLLAQPGNPAALAGAIARLIERPDERAAMGRRGRERLLARFSLAAFVDAWHGLYAELAA